MYAHIFLILGALNTGALVIRNVTFFMVLIEDYVHKIGSP